MPCRSDADRSARLWRGLKPKQHEAVVTYLQAHKIRLQSEEIRCFGNLRITVVVTLNLSVLSPCSLCLRGQRIPGRLFHHGDALLEKEQADNKLKLKKLNKSGRVACPR